VTHPFHPLYGRDFEFVAHRQNWGEDRVHLHDETGQLFSLPAAWTCPVTSKIPRHAPLTGEKESISAVCG
jgi:hypothetical protein